MRFAPVLVAAVVIPLQAQSAPTWRYTEELRIGSEADDATGFSDVRGLLVDRNRNVWVLEASLQEIRIFSPTGQLLKTVGRKGKGPGEFTYANGMALAPDGLIWVPDPQNARFSIFDQAGKFVRQQLASSNGYGYVWFGGVDANGRIWDRIFFRDPKDPEVTRMRRATPDWSRVDTLALPKCGPPGLAVEALYFKFPRGTMRVPFYPQPVSVIDYSTETMWCAPSGAEYRFARIGLARGDTIARVDGKAQRIPVSTAERDTAIAQLERFKQRAGDVTLDYSRIPRVKPLLQGAFVDGEGRLWVRRTSADSVADFDIYGREGRSIGTLRIPQPVSNWISPTIRDGLIWFLAQEEGEIPYVVRARIGPPR